MPRQERNRNFAFTYHAGNDYIEECEERLLTLPCKYLIFQYELGKEGTVHIQGFCTFENKITYSTIQVYCPGIHVEKAKASALRNIAYCSKLDTRVAGPYEHGERPCQGYRSDLAIMGDMVKAGKDPETVVAEMGMGAARVYKHLQVYASCLVTRGRDFVPRVFIRWGDAGAGKTRWAYDNYKTVHKIPYNNPIWWDGYCNQDIVVFDDWDLIGDRSIYNQLLNWTDRYPTKVPIKGGMVNLGTCDILITSNFNPITWFSGKGMQALARRVTSIEHVKIEKDSMDQTIQ